MADPIDRESDTVAAASVLDRRRPGRFDYHNLHLIALLRRDRVALAQTPTHADVVADPTDRRMRFAGDDLAAARGIGLAAGLGSLFWAGVAVSLGHLFMQ